jgi:hypothetical protein
MPKVYTDRYCLWVIHVDLGMISHTFKNNNNSKTI